MGLESNRLLLDMLMPLLDTKPSPRLPILMLPDLPRTLLTPLPFPLQSSLLPQHLMLPSPLHLSQLALLPLTPLSSRESLLPSELTPESPLSSPTLSHRSMSRSTTLMSQLLSHVPFPVRSSRSPMSPSLMRLLSHVLSQSQLHTRFTPSKRSLRPLISIPQAAHSYVAGPAQNPVNTIALPAPIIPAPPAPYAAIPPAPVPAGPAPADTVVQQRILAPVRTH